MKPIHTTMIILVVGALVAWGIWYYFVKKAPKFDMEAYNRIGSQGLLQGNMDYPYSRQFANGGGGTNPTISNSISYSDSGSVADPTAIARNRAAMMA